MKWILLIPALAFAIALQAQVAINTDGSMPDSSALLDVKSTTKGVLIPRMTQQEIAAIVNPANGLLVFCTTDSKVYFYMGPLGQWKELQMGTSSVNAPYYCGNPMTKVHTAGSVAPVNKTVTYSTITSLAGESAKCWITQNLGSDHQATAVNDATEPSAGWYWQFNKPQGYKHDGTTRTPNTTWNSAGGDDLDWQASNDPCAILLESGWRIPTYTEWSNVDWYGNWTNWNGAWNSSLKLHAAGSLGYQTGILYERGNYGHQWTSTSTGTLGRYLMYTSTSCDLNSSVIKSAAKSLRCIRDWLPTSLPEVNTGDITNISRYSASCGGEVLSDGGTGILSRGICYSTSPNPTIDSPHTYNSKGIGAFTATLTGLSGGSLYYVRAYASNSLGTAYGVERTFTTMPPWVCGDTVTKYHLVSGVAPVTKTVSYQTTGNVPGESSKCWFAQNLGSDHQATALNDTTEPSAGWYWQFNKYQGYKHDGIVRTPSASWINPIDENYDWMSYRDPCNNLVGNGWRLPTASEWSNVNAAGGWSDWNGPWNSLLKIHAAGMLDTGTGNLILRGLNGGYWSSSQYNTTEGFALWFSGTFSYMEVWSKASGFTVRCLKE